MAPGGRLLLLLRLGGQQRLQAGHHLLPHAGDAEEQHRLDLAERGAELGQVGAEVDVGDLEQRQVEAEHPLGDVRVGEVGDLGALDGQRGDPVGGRDLVEARWCG